MQMAPGIFRLNVASMPISSHRPLATLDEVINLRLPASAASHGLASDMCHAASVAFALLDTNL